MAVILIFGLAIYAAILLELGRRWKLPQMISSMQAVEATLVVPFRNEAENLPAFLKEVMKLTIAEVIFVNDSSEDDGRQIVRDFISRHKLTHWQVLDSPDEGKKAAVHHGVGNSANGIIYVSDADCSFPEDWVRKMGAAFADDQVQMVCGPVMTEKGKDILGAFQQVDWCSLLLVTHYFFRCKKPLMCSAANMAYRKSAFEQVNGFAGNRQFLSGDDEFLLKKIVREFGSDSVVYCRSREVLVKTLPEKKWADFLGQRARWASKWEAHKQPLHAFSAVLGGMLPLVFLASPFILVPENIIPGYFFVFWALKCGVDYLALGKLFNYYLPTSRPVFLIVSSFLHPLYVLLVVWRTLFTKLNWKGRAIFAERPDDELQHVRSRI